MATRAVIDLKNALIKTYIVKNTVTTVAGTKVKFSSNGELEIDNASAGEDFIGTVQDAVVGDGVKKAQVVLDFWAIVPMVVGIGGSTCGKKQVIVATGITDAAAKGVTTAITVAGVAMQTGVVGDLIGVGLVGAPYAATV